MNPSSSNLAEAFVLQRLRATPEILTRLAETTGPELHVQQILRREFPDDIVRAAMSLVELRLKAAPRFTKAAEMWFDRRGLEQATSEAVARHKATRFQGRVWDYCSGIGADAVALAARGETIALDDNPAACLRTRWHAEVYGVRDSLGIVCADVKSQRDRSGLLHFDPDRRPTGSARVVRIEDYVPGLDYMQQMTREFAGGAIKLSPAANFAGKFPGAEIELISLGGECKEATVWFGELAGEFPFRATVLPAGVTLAGDPMLAYADVGPLGGYLYDPDPAVVRAGLVERLCEELPLQRLDPEEEYLTSIEPVSSPFVQRFEVLADLPNNPRAIRNFFRTSAFGQVEIKCRRIPIAVEDVRKHLPLPGNEPGVLIFARLQGKARAIVCRRSVVGELGDEETGGLRPPLA